MTDGDDQYLARLGNDCADIGRLSRKKAQFTENRPGR